MRPPAPREAVRAITSATGGAIERGWTRWRGSMALRVVVLTGFVGLASVAALGAYVSSQIRDGLVSTKVDRILAESARDAANAQLTISESPARTPGDLQTLVNDLVTNLHAVGGENRGVLLLRQPGGTSQVFSQVSTPPGLQESVTVAMRGAVQAGQEEQSYQYVYLADRGQPGVVVGAPLSSTVAGNFELYFVYSLVDEQTTLTLIQKVLVIGGAALVALVVFMTWTVTLQAVRPVRQAARVAARLAEGLLGERMVVQGRDEMATLATTFNDMAESLQRQITRMEELSRLQRRFVSDVSHELRTPLTTVRMAADVLHDSRGDFSPEVARSAELLHAQLDRFESLLSDLLEISRIDAGAAQLEFEDASLLVIAREEIEAITPVATSAGVHLRLWRTPGEPVASMDRPRIARIVRNLLSNAIEYAQRGPIDILVGSNRRGVAIMVRDYGQGMTPQQAARVFDRFWRGDAARTRTMGGTGLGLAIAREDALLHGGALEAWGSPGHGASFRLSLPRTAQGLGQQPIVPLVAREREFARLGEAVEVGPSVMEAAP